MVPARVSGLLLYGLVVGWNAGAVEARFGAEDGFGTVAAILGVHEFDVGHQVDLDDEGLVALWAVEISAGLMSGHVFGQIRGRGEFFAALETLEFFVSRVIVHVLR